MNRPLLAAALFTLAVACGTTPTTGVASVSTSSAAPAASASASPTGDPEERGRQYARCMREQGVEMDDPGSGGEIRVRKIPGGRDKFEAAMKACRQYTPFANRAGINPQDLEQLREFAKCMRGQGIDMPDPDPNGGGGALIKKREVDEARLREAMKACEGHLPGRGSGQ